MIRNDGQHQQQVDDPHQRRGRSSRRSSRRTRRRAPRAPVEISATEQADDQRLLHARACVSANTSRPICVVPNQWSTDGGLQERVEVVVGVLPLASRYGPTKASSEQQHEHDEADHRRACAGGSARSTRRQRDAIGVSSSGGLVAVGVCGGDRGRAGSLGHGHQHPHPRVERGVDDVGQEARRAGPGPRRSSVTAATALMSLLVDRVDEPLAHAVPAEDLLGEGRADEQQRRTRRRRSVAIGISAVRSAVLEQRASRRCRPLACAVRRKSLPSTSSIALRW